MMNYPRVLIIANEALSNSTSNGRTLSKYLVGWPRKKLAQFCLGLNDPNYDMCNNYFCVTDSDALNCFIKGSKALRHAIVKEDGTERSNATGREKTMMLAMFRHIIWSSRRWMGVSFNKWINEYKPDVILLLSSDCMFLSDLALYIAEEKHIPIVIFNAEGYYFFKKNFYKRHFLDFFFHPLYMRIYRKHYCKLMRYSSHSVFLNDMLKEDYDNEFKRPSTVLYTSSELEFHKKEFNKDTPKFSYLGNFSPNRQLALVDIATCLHTISPNYFLDVFGGGYGYEEKVLKDCPYIHFHGKISYDEVVKVMRQSDVLFHAETNEERWIEYLRYGFSTKIADSLSCGTSFLLYAPSSIACAQYVQKNGVAWYANNKETLLKKLYELLNDDEKRELIISKAHKISLTNHNVLKNASAFKSIVIEAVQTFVS